MMKVAFLIASLTGGGAEKVLLLLANEASLRGWQITVYTLSPPPSNHFFSSRVKVESLLPYPWRDRDLLIPLYTGALCYKLHRLKADLLLSWLPRSNYTALVAKTFLKIPVWITEHADTKQYLAKLGWRGRVARILTKVLYPKADGVIAVSKGVATALKFHGVAEEKIHVVHNPVELIQNPAPEGPDLTIVTMGRLSAEKNQSLLLKAFHLLKSSQNVKLRLVGDGPERGRLVNEAKKLGISDRLEITGWLDEPVTALSGASVFAFTSNWEGFGNAIIEAMAVGLPVVTTDCPSGPSEILNDGEFGILVPTGDTQALVDALEKLIASPELRTIYREKSLKRAKDFEVKKIVSQYCELLNRAAGSRPES